MGGAGYATAAASGANSTSSHSQELAESASNPAPAGTSGSPREASHVGACLLFPSSRLISPFDTVEYRHERSWAEWRGHIETLETCCASFHVV